MFMLGLVSQPNQQRQVVEGCPYNLVERQGLTNSDPLKGAVL
jgi:hypothetical protein